MSVYMSAEGLYYLGNYLSVTLTDKVGNWVWDITLSGITFGLGLVY